MHTTKYLDYCLEHEIEIKEKWESPLVDDTKTADLLGDFGDKLKYCGVVSMSGYLSRGYNI